MTRVADRLGTGSSFNSAGRNRSPRGKAKAIAQGDIPAYELVRLHLDEVAPTPLNPRRNFGSDEDKTRFGEELRNAQLSACVAVTRDAYLDLWPAHAEHIGEALHILVNGERRYRSAIHVGLDALDFVVRNDLASSREEFINHLLKENLEREDFDLIERARGVEQLVEVCSEEGERGARARAAERLGKDRSWVTNQLGLLKLPQELQAMVSSGNLPERDARALARTLKEEPHLEAADLLERLKAAKAQEAETRAKEKAILAAAKTAKTAEPAADEDASSLSADNNSTPPPPATESSFTVAPDASAEAVPAQDASDAPTATEAGPNSLSADNNPPVEQSPVPHQSGAPDSSLSADNNSSTSNREKSTATAAGSTAQPKRFPYHDGVYAAQHLIRKMSPDEFGKMLKLLVKHQDEVTARST